MQDRGHRDVLNLNPPFMIFNLIIAIDSDNYIYCDKCFFIMKYAVKLSFDLQKNQLEK